MKFLHIADLHLGKKLWNVSFMEDQDYILNQIAGIVKVEKPDAVLIAGDVYDKSPSPSGTIKLFESFLYKLVECGVEVFVTSGNHDDADILSFCNRLLNASKIHIASPYSGDVEPITIKDEFGPVNVYMLPFVKPSNVRRYAPGETISNFTDAARVAVRKMHVNKGERNVLVAHQYVAGAEVSDDEVGDQGPVDPSAFDDFDYVALGHIHGSQNIGPWIRYCGSPLKYSESEARRKGKSVTITEMDETGEVSVREVPLKPLRDVMEIKGKFAELTDREYYTGKPFLGDYLFITLTDEDPVVNAAEELKKIYEKCLHVRYDSVRIKSAGKLDMPSLEDVEKKSPLDMAEDFYVKRNGKPMSDAQHDYIKKLIDEIWGEDE